MRLLERDGVLSSIEAAWSQAHAGTGRVVLVSGEAGIGKTSLVAQFAAAHDAGVVAWGRCDSLITPRELGPARDIAVARGGPLQECFEGSRPRTALYAAFIAELRRTPCVFVFEDLHWADEATLDLVKYLGRRIADTSSMLVVTFRDEEQSGRERLRSVVGDLPASSTVRVVLESLSLEAVRILAGDERCNELHAATGGNPFFVSEVLAAGEARVPASVRDAVLGRVARLSAVGRAVVELASIEPAGLERAVLVVPRVMRRRVGGVRRARGTESGRWTAALPSRARAPRGPRGDRGVAPCRAASHASRGAAPRSSRRSARAPRPPRGRCAATRGGP